MNGKIEFSLYALALLERNKRNGMEAFYNTMSCELPYIVLPSVAEKKVGTEAAYCLRDNAVPARQSHWMCYPELNAFEEWYAQCGTEEQKTFTDVEYLDLETDFTRFGVNNFMHSHYHTLKACLLVRNCLSQFMRKRVDLGCGTHRCLYTNEVLSTEELAAELKIFIEAVRTAVDATMQKRYQYDATFLRNVCYKIACVDDVSPLSYAILEAITEPEKMGANLSTDELGLDGYKSRIFGEYLVDEVMRFMVEAYTLVYHEI